MDADLFARAERIRSELVEYGKAWGGPATLLAVTKTQDADRINALKECGVLDIGENRVQEWQQKQSLVDADFRLHIIGRLQTNKVKYIIERAVLIHSLDREALALEISRRAEAIGRRMPVLVEVNIAGEDSKAGLPVAQVLPFLRAYGGLPGLQIAGLMTVLPQVPDAEEARPWCRQMRQLFEEVKSTPLEGVCMTHLSMGMSLDYRVAAQEGATLVRIGSALFGPRG